MFGHSYSYPSYTGNRLEDVKSALLFSALLLFYNESEKIYDVYAYRSASTNSLILYKVLCYSYVTEAILCSALSFLPLTLQGQWLYKPLKKLLKSAPKN